MNDLGAVSEAILCRELGFSGTRQGMTSQQQNEFLRILKILKPNSFHHGMCIGSDYDAHLVVREFNPEITIVGHPPINVSKMADVEVDVRRPPGSYLNRDNDIVQETDRLIATPRTFTEERRGSGTWYTIREARRRKKPTIIIYPDGTRSKENH